VTKNRISEALIFDFWGLCNIFKKTSFLLEVSRLVVLCDFPFFVIPVYLGAVKKPGNKKAPRLLVSVGQEPVVLDACCGEG
jgi:hypothetical protein